MTAAFNQAFLKKITDNGLPFRLRASVQSFTQLPSVRLEE